MIKRTFDTVVAALGLLLIFPLLLVIALLIKLNSPGPILFRQIRVGRQFCPFLIHKFRTMREGASEGIPITIAGDSRVTMAGRFLRATKLDELPQLINVLRGEMSIVGPRPELPQYVERFKEDYAELLRFRPGMTDMASLKYRDEATMLAKSPHPEEYYVKEILPDKIRLGKEYLRRSSFFFDLSLILRTVFNRP